MPIFVTSCPACQGCGFYYVNSTAVEAGVLEVVYAVSKDSSGSQVCSIRLVCISACSFFTLTQPRYRRPFWRIPNMTQRQVFYSPMEMHAGQRTRRLPKLASLLRPADYYSTAVRPLCQSIWDCQNYLHASFFNPPPPPASILLVP